MMASVTRTGRDPGPRLVWREAPDQVRGGKGLAMRVAPDLVGALGWDDFGALMQGAQVLVSVADGANAPSGGRSGATRLEAGRRGAQ